jgi:hypothetical protein
MSAPTAYADHLAQARLAAIKALTDILATSDDPTERRLAATAILRIPDPEPPPAPPRHAPEPDRRPYAEIIREHEAARAAAARAHAPAPTPLPEPRDLANNPLATTHDLALDTLGGVTALRPQYLPFRRKRRSPADLLARAGQSP